MSVRVVPLGRETHPLSVCACSATELSVLVSSRAGDWSRALATLVPSAGSEPSSQPSSFEVEVGGPWPAGGGGWSLSGGCAGGREPALLLLAGGTGVTGWLPGLRGARATGRPCHLVWCVQSEADYLSLAERLPTASRGVEVSVFVTRATADGPPLTPWTGHGESESAETCEPRQLRAGSAELIEWLAAALVGLAVSYSGWRYLVEVLALTRGWAHTSLLGYTTLRRALPICLITLAMAGTMAICRRAAARIRACASRRGVVDPTCTEEMGRVRSLKPRAPLFTGGSSTAGVLLEGGVTAASVADEAEACHSMHAGRPDLEALVRTAATAAASTGRLVVAACGPPALVEAARKAVAAARKGSDVHLEFTGTDPRW